MVVDRFEETNLDLRIRNKPLKIKDKIKYLMRSQIRDPRLQNTTKRPDKGGETHRSTGQIVHAKGKNCN